MDLRANNPNSTFPAVQLATLGKGTVLNVNHKGASGSLATFQVAGSTTIRFTRAGKGIFDGGTQTGGADVAEAFEVELHHRGWRLCL
jgi:trimeric autotransporter adhesin